MSDNSRRYLLPIAFLSLLMLLSTSLSAQIAATRTQPEDGTVSDKPVRSLRIWFDSAPVVEQSEVKISGPAEATEAVGTHTMGDNDLMVRISGPMPDGEYTVNWTAAGDDGKESKGSFKFTVKRTASDSGAAQDAGN